MLELGVRRVRRLPSWRCPQTFAEAIILGKWYLTILRWSVFRLAQDSLKKVVDIGAAGEIMVGLLAGEAIEDTPEQRI